MSRKQLLHFTAILQVELIGMEACDAGVLPASFFGYQEASYDLIAETPNESLLAATTVRERSELFVDGRLEAGPLFEDLQERSRAIHSIAFASPTRFTSLLLPPRQGAQPCGPR